MSWQSDSLTPRAQSGRCLPYNQCTGTPSRDEYILTIQLNSVERSGGVMINSPGPAINTNSQIWERGSAK